MTPQGSERERAAAEEQEARRRLLATVEETLARAAEGDRAQHRAELARLSKRADALLSGEGRVADDGRRNLFERARDAAGAAHDDLALLGSIGLLVAATCLGVFGPFLIVFGLAWAFS